MRSRQAVNAAAIVAAMAMPTMAWAARQQPPVHDMAGMGQPASQGAVAACAQAQPQALQTLDAANQRLEVARQSNSAAAMRTAVDDLQGALRQVRALLGACSGLQATAADMHAGHVMPGGQPTPNTTQAPPGAADPHAGHVMPAARQAPAAAVEAMPAIHATTTTENPAARLADLTCQPQVDRDTAPRATHLGQAYYFCTAADRDLFLKTPAKYLQR